MGFEQGKATTCVFYHPTRKIIVVIRGDDFTALGYAEDLDWYREELRGIMEITVKARLGPNDGDDKSIRVLSRLVEWTT